MTIQRILFAAMLLLLGAGRAAAQSNAVEPDARGVQDVQDAAWISYRDAYKQMIRFEKYGKPKHLIQQHYQVVRIDGNASLEGVRLTLSGPKTHLDLPLDAVGRTVFPYLKAAYDDNARLVLNRKASQYALQPSISIAPRTDGIYSTGDLRAACEQVMNYLRYIGKPGMDGKTCAGVRFSYTPQADPIIRVRSAEHGQRQLPVEKGSPFADDTGIVLKTVTYRFTEPLDEAQVVTQQAPAAITAVFK